MGWLAISSVPETELAHLLAAAAFNRRLARDEESACESKESISDASSRKHGGDRLTHSDIEMLGRNASGATGFP